MLAWFALASASSAALSKLTGSIWATTATNTIAILAATDTRERRRRGGETAGAVVTAQTQTGKKRRRPRKLKIIRRCCWCLIRKILQMIIPFTTISSLAAEASPSQITDNNPTTALAATTNLAKQSTGSRSQTNTTANKPTANTKATTKATSSRTTRNRWEAKAIITLLQV